MTDGHSLPHPFVLHMEVLVDCWLSGLVFQGWIYWWQQVSMIILVNAVICGALDVWCHHSYHGAFHHKV